MVSETLPKGVAREIAELPDLPRDALVERWIEFYGIPPIKTLTKDLLVRAIAYERAASQQPRRKHSWPLLRGRLTTALQS
jgi:hypothetical protein